jgi:hypothetical protein
MKVPRFLWRILGKAIKLLDWLALKFSRVGEVDGIGIYDLTPKELSESTFLQPTAEALGLIRQHDPRRYRRVCRYIKCIVNRPLITAGSFEWRRSMCNVDYNKRFTPANPPQWNLRVYACLLVHEATHGLLRATRLPYNDKTWERTERLCSLEEYRFIRRVDEWWADEYRSPKQFNPELWRRHRKTEARQAAWRKRGEEWHQERLNEKREQDREKRHEILRKKGRRLF